MPFIVKNTTLPGLLDLLAPHTCRSCGHIGEVLCERCKNNIIFTHENYCPNCKRKNPTGKCKNCKNLPPIFIVGRRDDIIGELVHDLKYNSTRALARPLAELLDEILPVIDGPVALVPLPTISRHIRERGFDHTLLIMKQLKKLRGHQYRVENLLLRAKNTVQVGSDEKTRLKQAESAYELAENLKIDEDTTYILFDDVWTTGASMKAALKKLRQAGARKIILSILAVNRLD